ncbi:hypothetical protein TVAG_526690 [Trichomonas vaginalis G3]|uniref:Uncharacterized protein n=1 Tax=Trichomonas vaginalis (strain ATCC PRA-98 / G3) TaxID=412133 RepID=A2GK34_TRIV3|nr:hypothetical protein TVAG_526690 [Trichomonas vaginalis G3]|eukprot:XP_001295413.1 hypothetical protein [Trichomonas vaginalis G3]
MFDDDYFEPELNSDEQYDCYIDNCIQESLNRNRNGLEREILQKIPRTDSYYNAITAAIGKQFKGKTLAIIKEIIKISQNDPYCHLLIYINRSGTPSDSTFESLKNLINVPIVYKSHEEAEAFIHEVLLFKELYNLVKKEHLENRIVDKQTMEMFETLQISDYSKHFLHTLIFLDDAVKSSLIEKPNSKFNKWLT